MNLTQENESTSTMFAVDQNIGSMMIDSITTINSIDGIDVPPPTKFHQQKYCQIIRILQEIISDVSEEMDFFAIGLIVSAVMIVIVSILAIVFHCRMWKKSQNIKNFETNSWLEYKLDRAKIAKRDSFRFSPDNTETTTSTSRCSTTSLRSSIEKDPSHHHQNFDEKRKKMITFLWNKSLIGSDYHRHSSSSPVEFECSKYNNNNNDISNKSDHCVVKSMPKLDMIDSNHANGFRASNMILNWNTKKLSCKNSSKKEKREKRKKNNGKKNKTQSLLFGKKRYYLDTNKKFTISDTQPFFQTASSLSSSISRSNKTVSEYLNGRNFNDRDYEIQTVEMNLTESEDGDSIREEEKVLEVENSVQDQQHPIKHCQQQPIFYNHRQRQRQISNCEKSLFNSNSMYLLKNNYSILNEPTLTLSKNPLYIENSDLDDCFIYTDHTNKGMSILRSQSYHNLPSKTMVATNHNYHLHDYSMKNYQQNTTRLSNCCSTFQKTLSPKQLSTKKDHQN